MSVDISCRKRPGLQVLKKYARDFAAAASLFIPPPPTPKSPRERNKIIQKCA